MKVIFLVGLLLFVVGFVKKTFVRIVALSFICLIFYNSVKHHWSQNCLRSKLSTYISCSRGSFSRRLLKFIKKEDVDVRVAHGQKIKLHVCSEYGNIKVSSWDKDFVRVSIVKRVAIKEDLDLVNIDVETKDCVADSYAQIVQVSDVGSFSKGIYRLFGWNVFGKRIMGRIDYTVMVPKFLSSINLETTADVTMKGFRANELSVKSSRGNITIADIVGDVTIYSEMSTIDMFNVYGNVISNVSRGNFQLVDIFGSVSLDARTSPVYMKNVKGSIDLKMCRGDISLVNVDDRVTVNTITGKIDMDNVKGYVNVRSRRSDLSLKNIHKGANVYMSAGPIEITRAYGGEGKIRAKTLDGQVTVRDSEGRVVSSSREVSIG